jgi:hypothetical protein
VTSQKHTYTARDALTLLTDALAKTEPLLHERVLTAIDVGTEIDQQESLFSGSKSKAKSHTYSKNVPFTDEQALRIAVDVLEAHLLEVRMFADSAMVELRKGPLADGNSGNASKYSGATLGAAQASMDGEIEMEPETTKLKSNRQNVSLQALAVDVSELQALLAALREMTTF